MTIPTRLGNFTLAALVAAIFLSLPVASAQATALPATITENMTLTAAGNPYTGSPTVEAGVTLKAEPGVKFNISKLIVKGTLVAAGTAEAPVVFTSGAKEPRPGDWSYVKFESGSGASVLDHTEVAYGALGEVGALEIWGASPTITHSTFRKTKPRRSRSTAEVRKSPTTPSPTTATTS